MVVILYSVLYVVCDVCACVCVCVPSQVVPPHGWKWTMYIVWLKLLARAWESVCRAQGIDRWCHLTHAKLGHLQRTCRTLRVENNILHIERRKKNCHEESEECMESRDMECTQWWTRRAV